MDNRHPLLTIVLAAMATACIGPGDKVDGDDWTATVPLPSGAAACPAPEDLDPATLVPDACVGGEVVSVDGVAELVPAQCDMLQTTSEPTPPQDCVYPVTVVGADLGVNCVCGRPFEVDGVRREAPVAQVADWGDAPRPRVEGLDPDARAALARAWAAIGAAEHASVASFARFALDLLAVGAPPELLAEAHAAAIDEVRHARLAFGLASAYAGAPIGPGPLPTDGALSPTTVVGLAVATAREGAVAETISALEMAEARDRATDPAVRAVLATIAADEARQAALAWRTLRWALAADPAVRASIAPILREPSARRGWAEVVQPAADALLA